MRKKAPGGPSGAFLHLRIFASVATVARPRFALQIEPNLRVRIRTKILVALIYRIALSVCGIVRATSGEGRGSHDGDCEKH